MTAEPTTAETHDSEPREVFTNQDANLFEAEDEVAGKAIGKMLSIIFVYTLIAMSIAAWWTWSSATPAPTP